MISISAGGRYLRYDCMPWVTWYDRVARRLVGWRANADRLSMHERTRPLPFLLPSWYADAGVQVVHAGLVGRGEHGVLFCGANGAGKSTSSLACLSAGFDFLSDDHVGVAETSPGRFTGYSVFASTRLEPDHLERFPLLRPHAIPSHEPFDTKSLVLVADAFPAQARESIPIRAIALPKVIDQPETRAVRIPRAEALASVAKSSLLEMPFGNDHERFAQFARLVQHVPTYRLELGHRIDDIGPAVDALIGTLG
jgi:hypothetical protein